MLCKWDANVRRCTSWNRYSTWSATCRARSVRLWRHRCVCRRHRWKSGFRTDATSGSASWRPNSKLPTWHITLPPLSPPSDSTAYHLSSTAADSTRRKMSLRRPPTPRLRPRPPETDVTSGRRRHLLPGMRRARFLRRWTTISTFRRPTMDYAHHCLTSYRPTNRHSFP